MQGKGGNGQVRDALAVRLRPWKGRSWIITLLGGGYPFCGYPGTRGSRQSHISNHSRWANCTYRRSRPQNIIQLDPMVRLRSSWHGGIFSNHACRALYKHRRCSPPNQSVVRGSLRLLLANCYLPFFSAILPISDYTSQQHPQRVCV